MNDKSKNTLKICLINPGIVTPEEVAKAFKDLPVIILPSYSIKDMKFIETKIKVYKNE